MTISVENPRYVARYQDGGNWFSVRADQYDRAVHGTNLRCGDDLCDAAVAHRKFDTNTSHGGSFPRHAHFYSLDRKAHRADCSWLAPEQGHRNSVTLADAFAKNYRVIVNLNFPVGNSLFNTFGNAADADDLKTPYNAVRNRYVHATVSAKSIQDFSREIKKLQKHDSCVLNRTLVAHAQDIKRYEDFAFGSDVTLLRRLYNKMAEAVERRTNLDTRILSDFPREFRFEPTDREMKHPGDPGRMVNGNPIILERRGKAAIILLNTLMLNDPALRKEIMCYTAQDVIATPELHIHEISKAKMDLSRGRDGYIHMYWRVDSQDQFQPAPDAQAVFKPAQDELRFA